MSLLLITHDLAVVAGMADYVAVMRKGEIVEQGETEHLFKTMSHPYTRQLFEASSHQPDHGAVTQETPILEVINATREYAGPAQQTVPPPAPVSRCG